MSFFKKLFSDSILYTFSEIFNKGLFTIFLPVLTRLLAPDEFGKLDSFLIFSALLYVFLGLELYQANSRYIPENNKDKNFVKIHFSTSIVLLNSLCFLMVLIFMLIPDKISLLVWGTIENSNIVLIGSIYIYSNILYLYFQYLLKWLFKSRESAIASILYTFLALGLSIVFIKIFKFSISGYLLGFSISAILSCMYILSHIHPYCRFVFDKEIFIKLFRFSFPLIFSTLLFVSNVFIDRVFVNFFEGASAMGIYSSSYRVAGLTSLLLVGFQTALSPLIMKNYKQDDTKLKISSVFRGYILLCSLLVIFYLFYSQVLVYIFLDKDFFDAWQYVFILAASILLFKTYVFLPGLSISNKTKVISYITLVSFLLNCLLNYWFIQTIGVKGAAYASLISASFYFLLLFLMSQKYYPIVFYVRRIAGALALIVITYFVFITFISDVNRFTVEYIVASLVMLSLIACILFIILFSHQERQKLMTMLVHTMKQK